MRSDKVAKTEPFQPQALLARAVNVFSQYTYGKFCCCFLFWSVLLKRKVLVLITFWFPRLDIAQLER